MRAQKWFELLRESEREREWKKKSTNIEQKKLSNNPTKKSIFMDAHEAQEVDGRGKKHVPASQPPWSYCMNGINLRKISMENPGKITQKLLNTHYNVFLLPPSRSRSIIYGGRNGPIFIWYWKQAGKNSSNHEKWRWRCVDYFFVGATKG